MKFRLSFIVLLSLVVLPLQAGVQVVNGLTHEFTAAPGQLLEGVITLQNSDSEPASVRAYPTGIHTRADGTYLYHPDDNHPRNLTPWLQIYPQKVTLSPKGTSEVRFQLRVPEGESLVGSYWNVVMIEGVDEGVVLEQGELDPEQVRVSMNRVMRYAVQLIVHIDESGKRKIDFLHNGLLRSAGTDEDAAPRLFRSDILNVGERLLRIIMRLELYNEQGQLAGRFSSERKRIYPDSERRYEFNLSTLPAGSYHALLIADGGSNAMFGARYRLNLK